MSTSNTFRLCSSCQSEMDTFPRELDPAHRDIYDDLCAKNRSNDIPNSEVERAQLQSLIERNSSDLQRYDDAIARLQAQRNQLDKIVQYQKSLISPIRKLSPDLLGEIFELVTADQFIILGTYRFGPHSFARGIGRVFRLTWICSWWRKLILSRPTLWSRIQLRLDDVHAIKVSQFINMMVEVLLRSGTTPLCLKIDEPDFSEFQLSVLNIPAGHTISRCKDLDIWLRSFSDLDKLYPSFLVSGTYFELMKLSIVIEDAYDLKTEPPRFLEHPSLNCPRLCTLRIPFLRPTDPIDLTSLKVLQIDGKFFGGYMRAVLAKSGSEV
ncbi:hypothetical protein BT96DRAFT_93585 [Gymnopus androsaceus JB14]|uniref:F-box domain-containing protein n=1 Tax=Gymnopus androsaceus JB14 TaxID=1447944 RepID=A0A6A4HH90_9AGAR|nr:hypothetical protein BT96DRAFT_93585 [Gymnopus androsaceus JB14]